MKKQDSTVLFISHDASRTGAPIFLLRFLRWFREHRQVPFQLLVGGSGDLLSAFEELGTTDLFEPQPNILGRVLRRLHMDLPEASTHRDMLRKRLAENNVGLVYLNTIVNGKILAFLSFLNCPVICHVHELEQAIRVNSNQASLDLVKRCASSYVAVSHAVKENLIANHGIAGDKVRVVHGFIPTDENNLSESPDSRLTVRRELGIPAHARLVCACGSIEPRKGTDLFVKVAHRVAEMYKTAPVHFIWVGGRSEQVSAMRKQLKSRGQQNVIHFIGHRNDVAPYYNASDLFLLPSREEALGLVMLEAALQKRAVVCFDKSGGAPEFVEQDAGFVVPGFDVNEMARKTIDLLTSDELRNRMGTVARQKVLDRHNLNTSAPRISELIEDALSSSKDRKVTL